MNYSDYPKGNFVKLSNFEKMVLFPSFKCWKIGNQGGISGLILQGTQACQGKNLDPCNWSNAEILCKTLIWYLEEPKAKGMKKGNQFFLFGFLELNRLGREWWRSIEEFREGLLNSLAHNKHGWIERDWSYKRNLTFKLLVQGPWKFLNVWWNWKH